MIVRFLRALRRHWLAVVIGMGTGAYVAFGLCLALVVAIVGHGGRVDDVWLATMFDVILMGATLGGAVIGYHRRRSG